LLLLRLQGEVCVALTVVLPVRQVLLQLG
jgi:hypothetical protein